MKRALRILSFLFLILLAISVVQAQDTLTQTYTAADGSFSIMYPAGWTADDAFIEAGFTQFSSGPTIAMNQAMTPLVSGDMGVALFIIPNDFLGQFGVSGATIHDFVISMSTKLGHPTQEAEDLTIGTYTAARVVTNSFDDGEIIGVDFGDGKMVAALGITFKGEQANLDTTMLAMLATAASGSSASTTEQTSATATISLQPKLLWTDTTFGFPVSGLAFSPDDTSLFIGAPLDNSGADTDLMLADATTGNALKTLTGLQRSATKVAFSPDGSTVAGFDTEALIVWELASGAAKATIQTEQFESPTDMAYNPKTGEFLYITQADPNDTLWQLDLASGESEALYTITDRNNVLAGLAFSPDGSSVLVGVTDYTNVTNAHATVYQIDLASHDATKIFDQPGVDQVALLYPAQGQPLIAVNPRDTYMTQVWDITSNTALYTLPEAKTKEGNPVATVRVAINPAGTILATGSISVEAQLWDAKTGAPLVTLDRNLEQMQNSEPYGFAFSHQGNGLAVFYGDRTVLLWSLDGSGAPATKDDSASPTATTAAADTTTVKSSCTATAAQSANLRTGPGTTFERAGAIDAGTSQTVTGQANGSDGFVWWKLDSGSWVRSDLVQTSGDCTSVPTVSS